MADQYLTTVEVAKRFGVDVRTVRRWLLEKPSRFPNAFRTRPDTAAPWLIPASDVEAELARQGK